MIKATWGGEGLFSSLFHISIHPKEVRAGTQTGQEPGGRSWCRSLEGMLLTGLLTMVCSACSLIEPRTTSWSMAPPTVTCPNPHQPLIKKMPYSQVWWRHFLNWDSLFSSSCQVDLKLVSTSSSRSGVTATSKDINLWHLQPLLLLVWCSN